MTPARKCVAALVIAAVVAFAQWHVDSRELENADITAIPDGTSALDSLQASAEKPEPSVSGSSSAGLKILPVGARVSDDQEPLQQPAVVKPEISASSSPASTTTATAAISLSPTVTVTVTASSSPPATTTIVAKLDVQEVEGINTVTRSGSASTTSPGNTESSGQRCPGLDADYAGMSGDAFIQQWPRGCEFSPFGGRDAVASRLRGKHVLFVGDSLLRYQVYALLWDLHYGEGNDKRRGVGEQHVEMYQVVNNELGPTGQVGH